MEEAERHAARSAEIRRRLIARTLDHSRSLLALAEIALLQGRLAVARQRYEEVLAIRTKLVPGTRDEADAHHGLGRVHREAGRVALAAACFERAIEALERQRAKLGGDEGLMGLTRAFHYAGARSVLASLWRVSDRSTADLVVRFYGHLRGGLPKAAALQAAGGRGPLGRDGVPPVLVGGLRRLRRLAVGRAGTPRARPRPGHRRAHSEPCSSPPA